MAADFPRFGVLVPSSNVSVERDYRDLLPPAVSLHPARMYMKDASSAAARALVDEHVWRAAEDLATAHPHVTVFSCTGAGAILGAQGEQDLVDRLTDVLGCPVVSTNQAVARALAKHDLRRLAILTPYVDDITAQLARARERDGYEVVHAAGMGIADNFAIARVTPEDLLGFAREQLQGRECDVLFVSCTNLRTAHAVALLERHFEVPVVTSNTASVEAALEIGASHWPLPVETGELAST